MRGKRAMTSSVRLTRFHTNVTADFGAARVAKALNLPRRMAYTLVTSGEDSYSFSLLGLRSRYDLLSRWEFLDVRGVLPETSQAAILVAVINQYLNAP